jgi:hypothetical protein
VSAYDVPEMPTEPGSECDDSERAWDQDTGASCQCVYPDKCFCPKDGEGFYSDWNGPLADEVERA